MKDKIKLSIFWVLSFLVMIFMMAFYSHAANVSGPQLPIVVDNTVNLEVYQNYINSNYGGFWNLSQDNVIGWGSLEQGRIWSQTFAIPQVPDQIQNYLSFSPINANTYPYFDYNNNTLTLTFSNLANTNNKPWRLITFNTVTTSDTTVDHVDSVQFNVTSTINRGVYGNTGNVINYISSDIFLTNNGAWVVNSPVFVNELPIIPGDIGVAILPDGLFTPDLSDIVPPNKVPPTYTPSDYTWTQKPTWDGSTVEKALESVKNSIEWGMENLDGEFNILKQNLDGWFKYLGNLLNYYLNGIIDSINAGIQNFYDNMANLVQPIFDKINYITTPLEADIIWDNISGTSLITNYSSIINAASSLKSSFENLSEPTEYKIPIHLENISTFGTLTTQYIDLSVINPVKPIIRTFMWALITYSLVVTIIDSIANYINGGGDES